MICPGCASEVPAGRAECPGCKTALHRPVIRFSGAGLAVGAVLLLAAGAGGSWVWRMAREGTLPRLTSRPPAAAPPLVAVHALESGTGPDGFALARLVAEGLSGSPHLRTVPPERAGRSAPAPDLAVRGELVPDGRGVTVEVRLVGPDGGERDRVRVKRLRPAQLFTAAAPIVEAVRDELDLPQEEAFPAAEAAVRRPEAWRDYARGLQELARFRPDAARERFEAALRAEPGLAPARVRLAWMLAERGEAEAARSEIVRAAPDAGVLPAREAGFLRALRAWLEDDAPEAVRLTRELIASHPQDLEARVFLGTLLVEQGDTAAARALADAMETLEPGTAEAACLRGRSWLVERDHGPAARELEECVLRAPESATARLLLAEALAHLGRPEDAAEEYRRAWALDPAAHEARVRLGVVEALAGRVSEAEGTLRALAEDEGAPIRFRIDAAFQRAWLLRSRGRFRDAAEALRQLDEPIRREQARSPLAWSVRGLSLAEAGDPSGRQLIDRALDAARAAGAIPTRYLFARALLDLAEGRIGAARKRVAAIRRHALPPEDPDRTEEKAAATLEGLAFLREMRVEPALERFEAAVGLHGRPYAVPWLGLGRAQLAAGRPEDALASARKAEEFVHPDGLTLEPELDRARARLLEAQARQALGRPDEARAGARTFLAAWEGADPSLPELAEARALAR